MKDNTDIGDFIERFVQWYYHFDDDNWFDVRDKLSQDMQTDDELDNSLDEEFENSKSLDKDGNPKDDEGIVDADADMGENGDHDIVQSNT